MARMRVTNKRGGINSITETKNNNNWRNYDSKQCCLSPNVDESLADGTLKKRHQKSISLFSNIQLNARFEVFAWHLSTKKYILGWMHFSRTNIYVKLLMSDTLMSLCMMVIMVFHYNYQQGERNLFIKLLSWLHNALLK